MNENQEYNSDNIRPYKASGNLNTVIANPSVNINDTMNINIQNMATNQNSIPNYSTNVVDNNLYNSPQTNANNIPFSSNYINNNTNNIVNNGVDNTNQVVNSQNNSYEKKTYVTTDNRPKKKIQLNLGPEFRIALLIVVILLVFIFLLPMISDLFRVH